MMCGIVACRTREPAAPHLIRALRLLEYRGYDSVGVCVRDDRGGLAIRRGTQRIDALADRLDREPVPGSLGIGHTRWATHGEVSERNAHPHRDCTGRLAVAHNGIIENAAGLRERLRDRGHEFASDVDSEVICHLLEDLRPVCPDLLTTLVLAVELLEGTWAIVALDAVTGELAAAADGSPLLVARSAAGVFAASDAAAIADWVDELRPLRDGDAVELGARRFRWMRDGAPAKAPKPVSALPARRQLDPLEHPDFMAKEIAEQPDVAARVVDEHAAGVQGGRLWRSLRLTSFERVIVLGCGTSLNAGAVVGGVFARLGGVPAACLVASEAAGTVVEPRTLVLAFSQSGETADVLRALDVLPDGVRVLAFTNIGHSTLARRADAVVPCLAGPEIGVAATKTFTAQVLAGSCVALAALVAADRLPADRAASLVAELAGMPDRLASALEVSRRVIPPLVDGLVDAGGYVFLGRGDGIPYAAEGALKLTELSYRWAEAFPAGELKHGPLALIEPGTPVIAIDNGAPRLDGNLAEVAARGGRVVRIGGPGASVAVAPSRAAPAPWGPLESVIPLQLIARELALVLGRDVDKPRNLAKAVTVD